MAAQYLADMLVEDYKDAVELQSKLPPYLVEAIKFVTPTNLPSCVAAPEK
jgi:hypothetical protein